MQTTTIKEVVFQCRDALGDMSNMLQLVEKTISEIEHEGEDIAIKGSSSILWGVIKKLDNMEKDMSKVLKGGN